MITDSDSKNLTCAMKFADIFWKRFVERDSIRKYKGVFTFDITNYDSENSPLFDEMPCTK